MFCNQSDLSSVYIGEGSFPNNRGKACCETSRTAKKNPKEIFHLLEYGNNLSEQSDLNIDIHHQRN